MFSVASKALYKAGEFPEVGGGEGTRVDVRPPQRTSAAGVTAIPSPNRPRSLEKYADGELVDQVTPSVDRHGADFKGITRSHIGLLYPPPHSVIDLQPHPLPPPPPHLGPSQTYYRLEAGARTCATSQMMYVSWTSWIFWKDGHNSGLWLQLSSSRPPPVHGHLQRALSTATATLIIAQSHPLPGRPSFFLPSGPPSMACLYALIQSDTTWRAFACFSKTTSTCAFYFFLQPRAAVPHSISNPVHPSNRILAPELHVFLCRHPA